MVASQFFRAVQNVAENCAQCHAIALLLLDECHELNRGQVLETIVSIIVVAGIFGVFALKSYAESCLSHKHPLNRFLNGDPSDTRLGGDSHSYLGDSDGGGCGGGD